MKNGETKPVVTHPRRHYELEDYNGAGMIGKRLL